MTDISRWPDLVHVVRLRSKDPLTGEWQNWDNDPDKPVFGDYVMVPLDKYHIGNLLSALVRSEDTGDWYDEMITILYVAMDRAGINEVSSNLGDTFTLEQVRTRDFKKAPRE